jgi:hypothetical protein
LRANSERSLSCVAERAHAYGLLGSRFRAFGVRLGRRLMATHIAVAFAALANFPNHNCRMFSMDFILKRLREPSTYAGIAAFLASFDLLGLTETDWNQIFGALAAVAAAAAIFLRDKSGGDTPG